MIHVVENGKIVESGRHERLLRLGQRYAEVYNLNFGAQLIPKDAAAEAEYPQRSKSIG